MWVFSSLNNSTSKKVLNVLESVNLIVWKVVMERVRMDSGGASYFEVEIWADTANFTNVIVAGLRKCRNLVWEGKVFIKNKAKVARRAGCSERGVMHFRKLLFKSELRVRRFAVIQEEICCRTFCKWVVLECNSDGWQ